MERKRKSFVLRPHVSEYDLRKVEAHIPNVGLEREIYGTLLNLQDINGEHVSRNLLRDMLISPKGWKIRILGTPSAGKTTVRLQLRSLLQDRAFGLHQQLTNIADRRAVMWTFDSYMRMCARTKGYGPVSKWTQEVYEQADEDMVEDIKIRRNSEDVRMFQEQGYLVDYIDEIPYVHNEEGRLLGAKSMLKASQEVQEDLETEGYSNSHFIILLPDRRTLEKGIEFRRTAISRHGDEISGFKNGLTLKEELANLGFFFIGDFEFNTDINRLIYENARRSAPPHIVESLYDHELERAQIFYYQTDKSKKEQKRATHVFRKISPRKNDAPPKGISEEFYEYLKRNDPDEITKLAVLAAYYDNQMISLGIPEENFSIAVNEFKYSTLAAQQCILVRLDDIPPSSQTI